MKEYTPEYDDLDTNNINMFGINNEKENDLNDLISPFKDISNKKENEPINFQKNTFFHGFNNNNQIDNNNINPLNDNRQFTRYELKDNRQFIGYELDDNRQFTRYELNDEERKYIQPRDSSFIDKILDFLFNW